MGACPQGGGDVPAAPSFAAAIDAYASYVGQSTCDPTAKPGVTAFRNLVLATYPCTTSGGISRDCSVGGTSEHKEGRAWDWMVAYPHPAATALHTWLLATDSHGNPHAMIRRFGIMYMIWNKQIWKAYQPSKGWQTYTGSNPHTDHTHFSFSWDGADRQTSFWTSGQPPTPDARPQDRGRLDPSTTGDRGSADSALHFVDAEYSNIPEDPLPPNEGVEVRGGRGVTGHGSVVDAATLAVLLFLVAAESPAGRGRRRCRGR